MKHINNRYGRFVSKRSCKLPRNSQQLSAITEQPAANSYQRQVAASTYRYQGTGTKEQQAAQSWYGKMQEDPQGGPVAPKVIKKSTTIFSQLQDKYKTQKTRPRPEQPFCETSKQ